MWERLFHNLIRNWRKMFRFLRLRFACLQTFYRKQSVVDRRRYSPVNNSLLKSLFYNLNVVVYLDANVTVCIKFFCGRR